MNLPPQNQSYRPRLPNADCSFIGSDLCSIFNFSHTHQDQNLGNWQVKRQVGSGAAIFFKFPVKFTLKAGQRVTVSSTSASLCRIPGLRHTPHPVHPLILADLGVWSRRKPQSSLRPGVEDSALVGNRRPAADHSHQRQWRGSFTHSSYSLQGVLCCG